MKNKLKNLIPWVFLFVPVLVVFRAWVGFGEISSGDAAFYFEPTLKDLNFFPSVWTNSGVGHFNSLQYAFPYLFFPIKILASLNLPWIIIERIVWYWPFILISVFSSWFFLKTVSPETEFRFLAPFVYLFNSYALMVVGGGQITIAFAYAFSPLLLAVFIKNINRYKTKLLFLSGLLLAIQVSLEPRIAVLVIISALFYSFLKYQCKLYSYLKIFLIPLFVVIGIHFFWLFPSIILRRPTYEQSLSSSDWVSFLSFAQFSNVFSLLHPNWPENIFGKIYFMRPEFLLIPALAFSSLFFIRKKSKNILFFALLGILGSFLAKGSNPPFSGVYLWLFNNIPGMNLFRDPTKFYLWVALSYSVLIPYSVSNIYEWIKFSTQFSIFNFQFSNKSKIFNFQNLFLLFIISYFLFTIRGAVVGQLDGSFKARVVPQEYVELKDFLVSQPEFFRTLWIPEKQRFGFYNNMHPAINGQEFFKLTSASAVVEKFSEKNIQEILARSAVKYVIIPYDSEGEIFLRDRKYDPIQRESLEKSLDEISWLKKINNSGKVAIYENYDFRDHFFVIGENLPRIQWKMINSTKYRIAITNATQPFEIIFSETYDNLWLAKVGQQLISSKPSKELLNEFKINKTGDFEVEVEFIGQKYLRLGFFISIVTLLVSIGGLIFTWQRQ